MANAQPHWPAVDVDLDELDEHDELEELEEDPNASVPILLINVRATDSPRQRTLLPPAAPQPPTSQALPPLRRTQPPPLPLTHRSAPPPPPSVRPVLPPPPAPTPRRPMPQLRRPETLDLRLIDPATLVES